MDITILIPGYNEEKSIGQVIDDLKKVMDVQSKEYEILVVDDGSTDKMADISREKGARVISHPRNRGTGAARTTGVINAKGELIVMIDGDCTYPTESIPELLLEMEKCDMVIGARVSEKGTHKFLRTLIKNTIKKIAELTTNTKIPDLNSGLRIVKRSIVMKYKKYLPNTHSWVSTITLVMLHNGLRVNFVPIKYFKRVGKSTFHPIADSYNYASLVIRCFMYFEPLKFFLPVSLLMGLIAVVKSIVSVVLTHSVQESDIILIFMAVLILILGLLADLIVVVNKPD